MSDIAPPSIVETLQEAAEGLLFPSETDAPLEPFFWPVEQESTPPRALTAAHLARLADLPPGTRIKTVKIETFFQAGTEEKEWHNAEERAEARRFQALVETLGSTLHKPTVFRVGEVNMDVYIVGAVEGGWAGLKTRIVET